MKAFTDTIGFAVTLLWSSSGQLFFQRQVKFASFAAISLSTCPDDLIAVAFDPISCERREYSYLKRIGGNVASHALKRAQRSNVQLVIGQVLQFARQREHPLQVVTLDCIKPAKVFVGPRLLRNVSNKERGFCMGAPILSSDCRTALLLPPTSL